MKLAQQLHRDVITDDAMESVAQVMAQRRIQVEREARTKERKQRRREQERRGWWPSQENKRRKQENPPKPPAILRLWGHPMTVGSKKG